MADKYAGHCELAKWSAGVMLTASGVLGVAKLPEWSVLGYFVPAWLIAGFFALMFFGAYFAFVRISEVPRFPAKERKRRERFAISLFYIAIISLLLTIIVLAVSFGINPHMGNGPHGPDSAYFALFWLLLFTLFITGSNRRIPEQQRELRSTPVAAV